MPRINLLPVKASRKLEKIQREFLALSLGVLGLVIALGVGHFVQRSKIVAQQATIQTRLVHAQNLAKEVRRVEDFRERAKYLESRLDVIAALQKKQQGPTRMLDAIATILSEREQVWLTSLRQVGDKLVLEGETMSHADLSNFQIALDGGSKIFSMVALDFAKTIAGRDNSVLQWKISCMVDLNAS